MVAIATGFMNPFVSFSVTTAALFHAKNRLSALNGVSSVISMNSRRFAGFVSEPETFKSAVAFVKSLGSVTTSGSLRKSNITSETGLFPVALLCVSLLSIFPSVTRPTSLLPAKTGSWSNPFSLIISMADSQVESERTVVTGFRRRALTLASKNWSFDP